MTRADFLADFRELSALGALPSGGLHRLAGGAADGEARRWLISWFREHGLDPRVDRVGNVFGLREFDPALPYLLLGSHLDSQPSGGRFDGQYGVLAAAHAAASVVAPTRPRVNLAVVSWTNEEGARFAPSVMGSSVFGGDLPAEAALAATDDLGITLAQALADIGMPAGLAPPIFHLPPAGYLEVHVEQGRYLEDHGLNIAAVDRCWGAAKLSVEVRGEQAHTGPTVMADRRDALVAAARLVTGLAELPERFPPGVIHTSVGWLQVLPNSPNVVPALVRLRAEIRCEDPALLAEATRVFEHELCAAESVCEVVITQRSLRPAAVVDAEGARRVLEAAESLGLTAVLRPTIAGHDAVVLSRHMPTSLFFIPSAGGITHNEREFTADRDLLNGVDLLRELVQRAL